MNKKLLKHILSFTVGIIPAVFLVSCQCVEDWLDRDKPLPEENLAHAPEQQKRFTRNEATAAVCNQLVMMFSTRFARKPALMLEQRDPMTASLAQQLYQANVISVYPAPKNTCRIKTQRLTKELWQVAVYDPAGKVMLAKTFYLKD